MLLICLVQPSSTALSLAFPAPDWHSRQGSPASQQGTHILLPGVLGLPEPSPHSSSPVCLHPGWSSPARGASAGSAQSWLAGACAPALAAGQHRSRVLPPDARGQRRLCPGAAAGGGACQRSALQLDALHAHPPNPAWLEALILFTQTQTGKPRTRTKHKRTQAHQPWKPASTGPRSSRRMSLATADCVLRHWRWGSSLPDTRPP